MVMYSLKKFEDDFINVDFDKILTNTNNVFVNSNQYYLKFKKEYLEKTIENKNLFIALIENYNKYTNFNTQNDVDVNKYSYMYIDINEVSNINNSIKSLLKIQKELYYNFISYINFLTATQ